MFEGQKYDAAATVEVAVADSEFAPAEAGRQSEDSAEAMSEEELAGLLAAEPLAVVETKYTIQDENYKSIYPDMLQAIIQNNTESDIKDAVVAFVAWDENGLPVKIEGQFDFGEHQYVKEVQYSDINLTPGSTYGDQSGYNLGQNSTIRYQKAIAVSYVTFEGDTWENPYYKEFLKLYEGQKITVQ